MSRTFTVDSNIVQTLPSPASDNLTALTLAGWVLITDYGVSGFPVLVKDPNVYHTTLYVNSDGTLFAGAGKPAPTGPIAAWSINAGGSGYAGNDVGHTTGSGTVDAPYKVFATGALGVVTDGGSGPTNPFGDGFSVGQIVNTIKTTGAGSGLKYQIDSISTASALSTSIETVPLNVWVHLAMTWDSAIGIVKLYINGVQCTYAVQVSSVTPDSSTGGWNIGKDIFGNAGVSQQKQTAVFNRALTGAEIVALAVASNTVQGIADSNLIAYWPLTSASPEPDLSGAGMNGFSVTATPPETVAATTPLTQASMVTPVASASMS